MQIIPLTTSPLRRCFLRLIRVVKVAIRITTPKSPLNRTKIFQVLTTMKSCAAGGTRLLVGLVQHCMTSLRRLFLHQDLMSSPVRQMHTPQSFISSSTCNGFEDDFSLDTLVLSPNRSVDFQAAHTPRKFAFDQHVAHRILNSVVQSEEVKPVFNQIRSSAPWASESEMKQALVRFNFNTHEAISYLKIDKLYRLGLLTTKTACEKALQTVGWDLEKAASNLLLEQ